MKIHGLQKMTLLDFPGKVACTVFLGGCDFRCPFCHNFELVDGTAPAIMDDEELLAFLQKRRGLLDGVAFTGGEPCLYKDLPELMRKIRAMGYAIKLDTNGNHPALLKQILEEGLVDYVAMDIKNSPEKYALTIDVPGFDLSKVRESLAILKNYNQKVADISKISAADDKSALPATEENKAAQAFDYELRTTVVKELHEAADFYGIGKLIEGAPHYYLQCFTDRDTVPYENFHAPSREEMKEYAAIASQYVPDTQIRGMDL